jgi:hypothetical protein
VRTTARQQRFVAPWTQHDVDRIKRRVDAELSEIKGSGQGFISRAAAARARDPWLKPEALILSKIADLRPPSRPAQLPTELLRGPGWDVPAWAHRYFLQPSESPQRPPDLHIEELVELVRRNPAWLRMPEAPGLIAALQVKAPYDSDARRMLGQLFYAPPTKRQSAYDRPTLRTCRVLASVFAADVQEAWLKAPGASVDARAHALRNDTVLGRLIGDEPITNDEVLSAFCAVVSAPERQDGGLVVLGSRGWPRAASLRFLMTVFCLDARTILRA